MKEEFEWIHSWCDNTGKNDLPRIVLVGDSITHNYQEFVRQRLQGKAYVDYIATSYSIDEAFYNVLIENFVKDSFYAILHFNFGLHGIHLDKSEYRERTESLLRKIAKNKKVILATSTIVYQENNVFLNEKWMLRVWERNKILQEIAEKNGYGIDDLFTVSKKIEIKLRYKDGTHYTSAGYEVLANEVASSILKILT